MKNPFKATKDWLYWKGLLLGDVMYALAALGFLMTIIVVMISAACQANGTF